MQIFINGEATPVKSPLNVAELIAQLALDSRKIAIERNRAIVSKSAYATTQLMDGDAIEIVNFVGGG